MNKFDLQPSVVRVNLGTVQMDERRMQRGNCEVPKGNGDGSRAQSASLKEQLEYIADLILQLKDMARSQRLTTLAGILDVAHSEARLRSRDNV
ncbi:hypothetical protein [Hyphomicrobium sp.]|uniref:hypothetical protein n=1 Tax=Hyphomicrobium sp. TaxID=82 RepID=UPI002C6BCB03|nr:hypothetical protein [Hyphomicrobium sp.]HRN89183.1 hypothetical protein [Hyphomicrobium sp.]HRQ25535.1 hypothetical protein [Hyphomicrobium sp.]